MTDTPGGPHRIDVHAHYLAPAYKEALQRPGHLLFGSDWPFAARMYAPAGNPQPALAEVFSGEELRAVEPAGALAQFEHLTNRSRPLQR